MEIQLIEEVTWCNEDIYAEQCTQLCHWNTTCSGHGHCRGWNSECICLDGWEGADCATKTVIPADPVDPVCFADEYTPGCNQTCHWLTTCSGHGHCRGLDNSCVCIEGWRGASCSTPEASGSCTEDAYAGDCEITCHWNTTCSGHGHCRGLDGSCVCLDGWTGADCSERYGTCDKPNYIAGCVGCGENIYAYKAEKAENGGGCCKFCHWNTTCSGHGHCRGWDGTCVCLPGWENCSVVADSEVTSCVPDPTTSSSTTTPEPTTSSTTTTPAPTSSSSSSSTSSTTTTTPPPTSSSSSSTTPAPTTTSSSTTTVAATTVVQTTPPPTNATSGANPSLPFFAYPAITVAPSPPVVEDVARISVVVRNSGQDAAFGVEVSLAVNAWGVGFGGWETIDARVLDVGAGGEAAVEFEHAFDDRGEHCLQAVIEGVARGGNADASDDRGQVNGVEVFVEGDLVYGVPIANGHALPIAVDGVQAWCAGDGFERVRCPGKVEVEVEGWRGGALVVEGEAHVAAVVRLRMPGEEGAAEGGGATVVVEARDTVSGERNHVAVHAIRSTPESLLNAPQLCCVRSVRARVRLERLLTAALVAVEEEAWAAALARLREFVGAAIALECELEADEKACVALAVKRAAAAARMVFERSGGGEDEGALLSGDELVREGLLQAAALYWEKKVPPRGAK